MNIIHYSIRSFFTNEYYSIIRFASKQLFVATLGTIRLDLETQFWSFIQEYRADNKVLRKKLIALSTQIN